MPGAWRWRASYAYVADGVSGLRIINVANPAAPTEVGFYDTPGNAYGVAVAGSYAYVADGDERPAHHQRRQPGRAHRGRLLRHARVCLRRGGGGQLRLRRRWGQRPAHHQRRQPGRATEVGFYDTPGYAQGVAVAGSYAYVAMGAAACASSTSPTRPPPFEVGFYDTPAEAVEWQWRGPAPTSPTGMQGW